MPGKGVIDSVTSIIPRFRRIPHSVAQRVDDITALTCYDLSYSGKILFTYVEIKQLHFIQQAWNNWCRHDPYRGVLRNCFNYIINNRQILPGFRKRDEGL